MAEVGFAGGGLIAAQHVPPGPPHPAADPELGQSQVSPV